MKKIGLVIKEVSGSRIKNSLKSSDAVLVIKYSGLSSPDITTLRQSLKGIGANLFVVKNSVARRALRDSGLENIVKNIDGPCGLVFVKEEPVDTSRILCNFLKTHEQLKLEGGFSKDKVLEKKDIESMAKLPSKDILRAQVVVVLHANIARLVYVLNANLKKLVSCLDQIKQKKSTVDSPQSTEKK